MEAQVAAEPKEIVRLQGVSFRYPAAEAPSLSGIDLTIRGGELVLLTGPTGCGKSTLLKAVCGIIPLESSGHLTGSVRVDGLETRHCQLPELARKVGLVFQSPDDQLCATVVADEVCFGPQNLGLDIAEEKRRLQWSLEQVSLVGKEQSQTATLSGGQKQKVAIAAQLAMGPEILALDEPISQLDPQGAAEVLQCLVDLCRRGLTVVLVEHRLGDCLALADRLVVMDQGRIRLDCPVDQADRHLGLLEQLGLKVPDALRARVVWGVSSREALQDKLAGLRPPPDPEPEGGETLMSLREVGFSYPESREETISRINLELKRGEVLAVVGPNGAGKSTLLGLMAGLYRPSRGELAWRGRPMPKIPPAGEVGLLLQNPDLLLLETTLGRELMSGPRLLGLADSRRRAELLAEQMGLAESWGMPPWALSKGQRLRAALGSILSTEPKLLLLDEPTTGQNQANIHRLLTTLRRRDNLGAMVLCSHDMETVARFADRVAVLRKGRLQYLGPTRKILARLAAGAVAGLKPHWPLAISLELGIDPPFLTLEEMLAVAGAETRAFGNREAGL